jgi:capsid protein
MQSRKKIVADRYASTVYSLWLEEAINKGEIENLPRGFDLYDRMNRDAISECTWIGASGGQVDELKETQAAVLRIKSGLSTYEIECARLGYDFRDIFEQQAGEKEVMEELNLDFNADPTKPGTMSGERGADGAAKPANNDNEEE